MISIVLPTFNGEKYIKESIESILEQTYTKFELIIVNDCSNDGTREIIEEYMSKDARIQVIHNKRNQKLPKSLNIGFAAAKGDYYTWTSDDNIYRKDALEKLHRYLKEHPSIDLVYAPYEIIDENGQVLGYSEHVDGDFKKLYQSNVIGACFLYKKKVHQKLKGYDETKFLVEDYDFWLRALRYFQYGFVNEKMYSYRIHDKSLSTEKTVEIQRKRIQLLEEEKNDSDCLPYGRIDICKQMIFYAYSTGDDSLIRKNLKELSKLSQNDYTDLEKKYKLSKYFPIKVAKIIHGE